MSESKPERKIRRIAACIGLGLLLSSGLLAQAETVAITAIRAARHIRDEWHNTKPRSTSAAATGDNR